MIRNLVIAGSCLALISCGSGGFNPIVKDSFSRINPFGDAKTESEPTTKRGLTREAVDKAGITMIRASLLSEENKYVFYGASENRGYVTYANQTLQSITLRGSRITGTRGLGWDLLASQTPKPDPLVTPVPPARWPDRITRIYTFPGGDTPVGTTMTFECTFDMDGPASVVIVGIKHDGVQFSETCSNDEMSFENLHLADSRNGFVWRTIQWIGPRMGNVDIEIVEPYTP